MKQINYQTYKKPSDFMKFDQGDNVIRIVSTGFLGKIHGMKTAQRWVNLGVCARPSHCKFCEDGNKPKTVWRWVVIDRKIDEARLLDAGPMIGDQICQIANKEGEPARYDLVINRQGEMLKTKYFVTKGKEYPITEEEKKKYASGVQYLKKTYIENLT